MINGGLRLNGSLLNEFKNDFLLVCIEAMGDVIRRGALKLLVVNVFIVGFKFISLS